MGRAKHIIIGISGTFMMVALCLLMGCPSENETGTKSITIGSKHFTEQEILGEIMAVLIEETTDITVVRKFNLGGTMVCFNALRTGDIDLYAEYTGTGLVNILNKESIPGPDKVYEKVKEAQKEGHVLRYVGELSGDLSQTKGNLEVRLVSVPEKSSLGQVQGSDSIFEIYTESYGERPLVIQGAGAGAKVTARGVFGDILRLTEKAV